jgi:hypothetical protein
MSSKYWSSQQAAGEWMQRVSPIWEKGLIPVPIIINGEPLRTIALTPDEYARIGKMEKSEFAQQLALKMIEDPDPGVCSPLGCFHDTMAKTWFRFHVKFEADPKLSVAPLVQRIMLGQSCRKDACFGQVDLAMLQLMNKRFQVFGQTGVTPAIDPVCDNCFKTDAGLHKCLGCRLVYYCSPDCQRADWAHHKHVCRMAKHQSEECSIQ